MIWLLCGYMWLFIHRPFEIWPWLGAMHVERVYMLVTIAVWAVSNKTWVSNRLTAAFLALTAVILFSWFISPYQEQGARTVEDFLKVAVFYVLVVTSVRDEKDLRRLVAAFLVSMGLYLGHSFREYLAGRHVWRMGTARMIGIDAAFNDPNTFAATVIYSLPMVVPIWRALRRDQVGIKLLIAGYVVLATTCVLLTGSRAGLVGLLCLAALVVARSPYRLRIALFIAVVAPLAWNALPPDRQERYLTLINPDRGPRNSEVSAEMRWNLFVESVELWKHSPVTGNGPNGFRFASGTGSQAHTLYAQVLSELGVLGVIGFLAVLLCFGLNGREMRRYYRGVPVEERDFPCHVSRAVGLAVILLLVLGCGGHNLFRYTWLWYGAFQAIALHSVRARRRTQSAATGEWPVQYAAAPWHLSPLAGPVWRTPTT